MQALNTKSHLNVHKSKLTINPFVIVILSFLIVIFVGSFFLAMPWTHIEGVDCGNYIDALFTAVSATCVTGVSTYKQGVFYSLNFGGQLVTIILIQIGGLGFITILTFIVTIFKRRMQFKNRYLISQMVNSTNFADVVKFVRNIVLISFICEFIGTILYFPAFYIMYDGSVPDAIWNSIYHSISSFNNAGFDLFEGVTSLIRGETGLLSKLSEPMYIYFCSVAEVLIVLGGISFLVILELTDHKKKPKQWRVFTKVVLLTTGILIFAGALLLWLSDGFKGPNSMSFLDCLFESISARTCGFFTYPQDHISTIGKIIVCFLMMVGGSPLSTAGGIKTTTIFMIVLAMISYFKSKKISAFNRSYSSNLVVKAMTLLLLSLIVILACYILLNVFGMKDGVTLNDVDALGNPIVNFDGQVMQSSLQELYIYEVFSCFGTVGFFNGIEPYLSDGSKIVLCFLMFLGRLGPFTFFQVFQKNMDKEETMHYKYVEEDFLIG